VTNSIVPPDRPHIYAFTSKRLVILASMVFMLVALSLMLGIRIERYQQSSLTGAGADIPYAGSFEKVVSEAPKPSDPKPAATPEAAESQPAKPVVAKPQPAKPRIVKATPKAQAVAPAPPKTDKKHYAIQVESSSDKGRAMLQIDVLNKKGFAAFIEEVDIAGKGTYYRVMIGPFLTKAQASDERISLMKDPKYANSLIRYIP
jgi:cell division septation protein DedD